jgi:hypothetical protein
VPKRPDAADTEIKRRVAALLRELQARGGQGAQADWQPGAGALQRPQPQRKPLFGGEQECPDEQPQAAGADAGAGRPGRAQQLPGAAAGGGGGARPLVCIVSDDLTFVETLGRCQAAGCVTVAVCEARVEMRNAHVTLNWAAVQDGCYLRA